MRPLSTFLQSLPKYTTVYSILFMILIGRITCTKRTVREAYASPTEWKRVNYKTQQNVQNVKDDQNYYGHKADYGTTNQGRPSGGSNYLLESETQPSSDWCYYCATPRSAIEPNMVDAMDQLFDMRTTNYPYDAVYGNCNRLTNMSSNPPRTQRCKYDICHTITFTDSKGSQLTVRGCAEKMTAVHEFVNDYCRKVHHKLNIVECFCKNKHVCMNSAALSLNSLYSSWKLSLLSFLTSLYLYFNIHDYR